MIDSNSTPRATMTALAWVVTLTTTSSVPLFAQPQICSEAQIQTLAGFSDIARERYDDGLAPPDVPPLNDCDPDERLHDPLGERLGRWIADAVSRGSSEELRFIGARLADVKTAYRTAGYDEDFLQLSRVVLDRLESLESKGAPVQLAPTAERNPTRFTGLDELIRYLEDQGATGSQQPPVRPDPAPPPPLDSREPSSQSNFGLMLTLAGLAVAAIASIAFLLTKIPARQRPNRKKSSGPDLAAEPFEPEPAPEEESGVGTASRSESVSASDEPHQKSPPSSPPPVNENLLAGTTMDAPRRPDPITAEWMKKVEQLELRHHKLARKIQSLSEIKERLDQLENQSGKLSSEIRDGLAAIGRVDRILSEIVARLRELEARAEKVPSPISKKLATLADELHALDDKVERTARSSARERAVPTPQAGTIMAALLETEQALLREDWKHFRAERQEIVELAQSYAGSEDAALLQRFLIEVARATRSEPRPSRQVAAQLDKARIYQQQLQQLSQVTALTERPAPSLPEEQKAMLLQVREISHLLGSLRSARAASQLLDFKLAEWFAEELREVADYFLCRYQIAQAEGRAQGFEKARAAVLAALKAGGHEPIEIILGETPFDSDVHTGRSQTSETRFPNGTIAQVRNNGFRKLRDNSIVVKPVVVPNRL